MEGARETVESESMPLPAYLALDPELQQYMEDISEAPTAVAFRSLQAWSKVTRQFEAKQTPPMFEVADSFTRWLRENKAQANYEGIHQSNRRRLDAEARVVRPLPWQAVGRRKLPPVVVPAPTTQRSALCGSHIIEQTPTVGHGETPVSCSLGIGDSLSAASAPAATAEVRPRRIRKKVPVTPRTHARLLLMGKPETHSDGVELITTILDSHYRHKNHLHDLELDRNTFAYRLHTRRETMASDVVQTRADHVMQFLRTSQRPQPPDHPRLDDQRLLQLYDGFATVCGWLHRPGPPQPVETQKLTVVQSHVAELLHDAVATGYLSLAPRIESETSPMPALSFSVYLCALGQTSSTTESPPNASEPPLDGAAAAAAYAELSTPQLREATLTLDAYRSACNDLLVQHSVQLFRYRLDADPMTFQEWLLRQFPGLMGRHVPGSLARLRAVGALPYPQWAVSLFLRYAAAASSQKHSKDGKHKKAAGWGTLTNVLQLVAHHATTEHSPGHHHDTRPLSPQIVPCGRTFSQRALPPDGEEVSKGGMLRRRPSDVGQLDPVSLSSTVSQQSHSVPPSTHSSPQQHAPSPSSGGQQVVHVDGVAQLLCDRGLDLSTQPEAQQEADEIPAAVAASIVKRHKGWCDDGLTLAEFCKALGEEPLFASLGKW